MCTVVLDFYSDTCVPCKALMRDLDEMSDDFNMTIEKLNIFDNYELTEKYNIRSVPTLVVLKDEEIKAIYARYNGKAELKKFLQDNVPSKDII